MKIRVNKASQTPLYQQIKNVVKSDILSGELPEGYKLPSERELARELGIHRNTVVRAYCELIQERLVISSRNSPRGYFVCRGEESKLNTGPQFSVLDQMIKYEFLVSDNMFNELYHASYREERGISLAGIVLADEDYPAQEINRILRDSISAENLQLYGYCDPQGWYPLRENLARMLQNRNMQVSPQNIQVVSETNEAIEHIIAMYLEKGDYVIMEEPMCPDIVNSFVNYQIGIIPVPMDDEGIDVEVMEQMIRKFSPKFVYTMPEFHNPTGIRMSLERRKAFLHCTEKYNIPVIEEDSQKEFNYTGKNIPSLYSMDRSGSVIYLDSSALSFFPGARVGYVVAPVRVIDVLRKIVSKKQIFVGSMGQILWSEFLQRGDYERHSVFLREKYHRKRDLMCSLLQAIPGIRFSWPQGGLSVWCRLPARIRERDFFLRLKARGVTVIPGYLFLPYGNKGENHIRLTFSGVEDEEMITGLNIIKEVIEEIMREEKE